MNSKLNAGGSTLISQQRMTMSVFNTCMLPVKDAARIRFSKERKCFSCARLLVKSAWCWLLEISILRNRLPSSQSGLARIVGRPCSGISYNARDAERPSQRWTCGSFRCGICLLTSSRSRSNGASVHTGIVGVVMRSYKSSN